MRAEDRAGLDGFSSGEGVISAAIVSGSRAMVAVASKGVVMGLPWASTPERSATDCSA